MFSFVVFSYFPPHQEQVGGTKPRLDPTDEVRFGHRRTNYDVVVAVDIDVSAKVAVSASHS